MLRILCGRKEEKKKNRKHCLHIANAGTCLRIFAHFDPLYVIGARVAEYESPAKCGKMAIFSTENGFTAIDLIQPRRALPYEFVVRIDPYEPQISNEYATHMPTIIFNELIFYA